MRHDRQFDRDGHPGRGAEGADEDLDRLAEGVGNRLVTAFAGAVIQGKNLSDVLKGLALSLSRMALSAGVEAAGQPARQRHWQCGGMLDPFAEGGIVNSPALFRCAAARADGRGGARGGDAAGARADGKLACGAAG